MENVVEIAEVSYIIRDGWHLENNDGEQSVCVRLSKGYVCSDRVLRRGEIRFVEGQDYELSSKLAGFDIYGIDFEDAVRLEVLVEL